jgi:hypothetical protein
VKFVEAALIFPVLGPVKEYPSGAAKALSGTTRPENNKLEITIPVSLFISLIYASPVNSLH